MHARRMVGAVVAVLIGSLGAPGLASADTGLCAELHEAVQRGQDVELTYEAWDGRHSCLGQPYRITRRQGVEEVDVVAGQVFSVADAVEDSGPACTYLWDDGCTEDTWLCLDCDGDGTIECFVRDLDTYCEEVATFTFVDECVPPGHYEYRLLGEVTDGSMGAFVAIDVVGSGDPCLPDPPAYDPPAEEPAAGCSAGGPASGPGRGAPLLMLVAGLLLSARSVGRR
jgi:hypothetical protein